MSENIIYEKVITIPQGVSKIGIFSDLQGVDENLTKLKKQYPEIKVWFCAGDAIDAYKYADNSVRKTADYDVDYNIPTLRKMLIWKIISVLGNHETKLLGNQERLRKYITVHDKDRLISFLNTFPFSITLLFGGKKIRIFHSTPISNEELIPHITQMPVALLAEYFSDVKADIIVFGHNHETYLDSYNGVQYINPGSLGEGKPPSFCTIDIEGNSVIKYLDNE